MKKLAIVGAAITTALTPAIAAAQTAPTTLTGMVDAIDLTDAKAGMLAAGVAVIGVVLLRYGFRNIKGFFGG